MRATHYIRLLKTVFITAILVYITSLISCNEIGPVDCQPEGLASFTQAVALESDEVWMLESATGCDPLLDNNGININVRINENQSIPTVRLDFSVDSRVFPDAFPLSSQETIEFGECPNFENQVISGTLSDSDLEISVEIQDLDPKLLILTFDNPTCAAGGRTTLRFRKVKQNLADFVAYITGSINSVWTLNQITEVCSDTIVDVSESYEGISLDFGLESIEETLQFSVVIEGEPSGLAFGSSTISFAFIDPDFELDTLLARRSDDVESKFTNTGDVDFDALGLQFLDIADCLPEARALKRVGSYNPRFKRSPK